MTLYNEINIDNKISKFIDFFNLICSDIDHSKILLLAHKNFDNVLEMICASHEQLINVFEDYFIAERIISYRHLIKINIFSDCYKPQLSLHENYILLNMSLNNAYKTVECLKVFYLSYHVNLLDTETSNVGTNNNVLIDEKKIVKKAHSINAKNLIIVHTHINNPKPSTEDFQLSIHLKNFFKQNDLNLLQSYVYRKNNLYPILNN